LGFDIGIPVSVRKTFIREGKVWNTDVKHNYYTFYLNAGWVVGESSTFKLSPHIGIGAINVSVCEADRDKVGGDLSMTQTVLQYGMACDLKLSVGNALRAENTYSYNGIRFEFDYFNFLGSDPILSGGALRLRVSWIFFGRPIVREM
jgi:hypothetical protein